MSLNGETCWTKTMSALDGTQLCGGIYLEEIFPVTGCFVTLSGSEGNIPLTVHVWTNLDGAANDESFGIDNVVITKILESNSGWIYARK